MVLSAPLHQVHGRDQGGQTGLGPERWPGLGHRVFLPGRHFPVWGRGNLEGNEARGSPFLRGPKEAKPPGRPGDRILLFYFRENDTKIGSTWKACDLVLGDPPWTPQEAPYSARSHAGAAPRNSSEESPERGLGFLWQRLSICFLSKFSKPPPISEIKMQEIKGFAQGHGAQ